LAAVLHPSGRKRIPTHTQSGQLPPLLDLTGRLARVRKPSGERARRKDGGTGARRGSSGEPSAKCGVGRPSHAQRSQSASAARPVETCGDAETVKTDGERAKKDWRQAGPRRESGTTRDPPATPESQGPLRRARVPAAYRPRPRPGLRARVLNNRLIQSSQANFSPLFYLVHSTSSLPSLGLAFLINIALDLAA
jgi:hypothetical protein